MQGNADIHLESVRRVRAAAKFASQLIHALAQTFQTITVRFGKSGIGKLSIVIDDQAHSFGRIFQFDLDMFYGSGMFLNIRQAFLHRPEQSLLGKV